MSKNKPSFSEWMASIDGYSLIGKSYAANTGYSMPYSMESLMSRWKLETQQIKAEQHYIRMRELNDIFLTDQYNEKEL